MDLYLTPTRYRSMGTGIDVSAKTDNDLHALLLGASQMVNSAVHAPEGYSFLGGSVSEEEHNWRVGDVYRGQKPQARVWPYMRPLISASALRINIARNQSISFDASQMFIQTALGYVEPTVTPNTTALYSSVPPWLLSSPVAYLTYAYGWNEVVTDERPATLSGGVLQGNHQFWFTDEDVILKKDGVIQSTSDYVVDYDEGLVTPSGSALGGSEYRISYHHHLPSGIALATSLVVTDMIGQSNIAAAGLLGLSGFRVEEVEVRQSSKVNFDVQPINAAALMVLAPYTAMFASMR